MNCFSTQLVTCAPRLENVIRYRSFSTTVLASAFACTRGTVGAAAAAGGGVATAAGPVAGSGWEGVCCAAIGGVEDGGGAVFDR